MRSLEEGRVGNVSKRCNNKKYKRENAKRKDERMVSRFSHDASTWERQLCEVQETRGQLTARSGVSKHSKDSVTSKTNPTHNPTATFEEKRREVEQE